MDEFKQVAIEAVGKAEEKILFYYKNLPLIEKKADLTPVTKADKEAEEIIIDIIRKKFPGHGFLGEELGNDNEKAEFVWIIDPIDGTKNFIHKIDFFGTVLGLRQGGEIILGVSNMPVIGELLFASKEEKTTLNGKPVRVSQVEKLEDSYVIFGGYNGDYGGEKFVASVLEINSRVINMRGFGDILGYHFVANGRADVMFEPSVKPWDVSSFQIIIDQAGGKQTNFKGERKIGPNSIATNGILHEEVLNILN